MSGKDVEPPARIEERFVVLDEIRHAASREGCSSTWADSHDLAKHVHPACYLADSTPARVIRKLVGSCRRFRPLIVKSRLHPDVLGMLEVVTSGRKPKQADVRSGSSPRAKQCDAEAGGRTGGNVKDDGAPLAELVRRCSTAVAQARPRQCFVHGSGGFCTYGGSSGANVLSRSAPRQLIFDLPTMCGSEGPGPGEKSVSVCGYWGPIADFDSSSPGKVWS